MNHDAKYVGEDKSVRNIELDGRNHKYSLEKQPVLNQDLTLKSSTVGMVNGNLGILTSDNIYSNLGLIVSDKLLKEMLEKWYLKNLKWKTIKIHFKLSYLQLIEIQFTLNI